MMIWTKNTASCSNNK